MRRKAARVPYTVPRYVTSVTRWHSAGVIACTGENTDTMALLTQMSIGPNLSSTAAADASTWSASATSVGRTRAWPPAASTSRRVPSSPSCPRASNPMCAPCRANAWAVARPTPAEAPVMTTTLGVWAGLPVDLPTKLMKTSLAPSYPHGWISAPPPERRPTAAEALRLDLTAHQGERHEQQSHGRAVDRWRPAVCQHP